jgi:cobalt transporter subunit CbtB
MSSMQQASAADLHSDSPAGPLRLAIVSACVGALLVYFAGFSQMEALHNGTHDARHAAGLACH